MFPKYDVIVVGAGHAGCEAAVAAANLGSKVLLATMNMQTIAQMSCNPAMGGVAKGQIVREIDALGGYSGIVTDRSAVQFRMLNRSKGPAMWSPRAQSDRMLFAQEWRMMLEAHPNVDFWQEMVTGLMVKDGRIKGVRTAMGLEIEGRAVVLTNGTFLNGTIHIGEKQFGGGRAGEKAAHGITEQLVELGFEAGRMKTGTPPRIDGRSLDYGKMEVQPGDEAPGKFSYTDTPVLQRQLPCYITYTDEAVHAELRSGFDRSPMFNGRIKGLGPRYCPSIEDKINRFADKDRHQLFVEPEGWNTCEIYVNGFSSSLPEDVQYAALRRVPGFENMKMFRPGYAIEYDYFPPTQLEPTLETRLVKNLFFAGQINGTTGYEEAAAQGLLAGANAALQVQGREPWCPRRDEAYLGVLVDDLITRGVSEPYRMFTSRAEYRLSLREDNADLRLTEKGRELGLVDDERWAAFCAKREAIERGTAQLKAAWARPEAIPADDQQRVLGKALEREQRYFELLRRPETSYASLMSLPGAPDERETDPQVIEQIEIAAKYQGYIDRQQEEVAKQAQAEATRLPVELDYAEVRGLSKEVQQKLNQHKPETIGQAGRIQGVTPAAISLLLVWLKRRDLAARAGAAAPEAAAPVNAADDVARRPAA